MRIMASTWDARRVTDVFLDMRLMENITLVDNVNGFVDTLRIIKGEIVHRGDGSGPMIDRHYGRVTIVYPRVGRRSENRSRWSRRKRRRLFRQSQQRSAVA